MHKRSRTENNNVLCHSADREPREDNFKYEECATPSQELQENEVYIKTLYLSVDPALRCRMNPSTGVDYMGPWLPGETIEGLGGIGVVIISRHDNFLAGQLVQGVFGWPWTAYFVTSSPEKLQLTKIDRSLVGDQPTLIMSVLGLIGLTSYLGIKEKGHVIRGTNQTCVVSGAAGACGSLAGQIAKIEGCANIVGICGTAEKCTVLIEEFAFNRAINYKTEDVTVGLQQACPNGIDVYFDNVGGEISNKVIRQMNPGSHVILCGQISVYSQDLPYPPPIPDEIEGILKEKNITRDRYLVINYPEKFEDGLKTLAGWVVEGKLKVRETVMEGLENAGRAFVSMMSGGNIGKQIVHVADV